MGLLCETCKNEITDWRSLNQCRHSFCDHCIEPVLDEGECPVCENSNEFVLCANGDKIPLYDNDEEDEEDDEEENDDESSSDESYMDDSE